MPNSAITPTKCKDGRWPCRKICDCEPINFYEEPEAYIQMHSEAIINEFYGKLSKEEAKLKTQEKTVSFTKKCLLSFGKNYPVIEYGKFKPIFQSPELAKLLQKIKAA